VILQFAGTSSNAGCHAAVLLLQMCMSTCETVAPPFLAQCDIAVDELAQLNSLCLPLNDIKPIDETPQLLITSRVLQQNQLQCS